MCFYHGGACGDGDGVSRGDGDPPHGDGDPPRGDGDVHRYGDDGGAVDQHDDLHVSHEAWSLREEGAGAGGEGDT